MTYAGQASRNRSRRERIRLVAVSEAAQGRRADSPRPSAIGAEAPDAAVPAYRTEGPVIYLTTLPARREEAPADAPDAPQDSPRGALARVKADPRGHIEALIGWLVIFGGGYLVLSLIGQ